MAPGAATVELEAHAKVNLTLEVLGRRDDGYHDIASIMQTVELHDAVTLEVSEGLSLECSDPALANDGNLVLVAARALREAAGIDAGAAITLEKRIPVSAGLGGGSSNAAAALLGLNRLWDLGLEVPALEEVAAGVGSDVPFFLTGGTALVQGRGEHVVPLPRAKIDWMVVLAPEIDVPGKTAALYRGMAPADFTRGLLTHKLAGRIRGGGDAPAQFYFNAFEAHAADVFPGLVEVKSAFRSVGAMGALLCGAGPSMFALAPSREVGVAWQLLLERVHGLRAFLTRRWEPRAAGQRRSTRRAHGAG